MKLKTSNTFVRCSCGKDVALNYIDEVRKCRCGRKVEFSNKMKKYIVAKYIDHKKDSEIKIDGFVIKPIKYIKIE